MKLYVVRRGSNKRVYLNRTATTRDDLRIQFGGDYFTIGDGHIYDVSEVRAISDSSGTAGGAVIGGLLGLLAGPGGLLIGAGLGGAIGNSTDNDDQKRVKIFNNSY